MGELDGKVALVTGAASGIGKAITMIYAREGARVVVSDMDAKQGENLAVALREQGCDARFVQADVSRAEECAALVAEAVEACGRLDIACNNAGIGGEQNLTGEYSDAGWQRVIDVNLSGVFHCMKAEIAAMLDTGGGAIVNMSSILGQVGFATSPAYVSAKHGVVGLTRTAALEYARRGIRVNAVGPAFIRTPMISSLEADAATRDALIAAHPMGRLGEPEEVAEVVLFVSSPRASFVTGSYYAVDGGYLAR